MNPSVTYVDLTMVPDTPTPPPPKRVKPIPVSPPPPPPSPTGAGWRYNAFGQLEPLTLLVQSHKTGPRRALFGCFTAVGNLEKRMAGADQ